MLRKIKSLFIIEEGATPPEDKATSGNPSGSQPTASPASRSFQVKGGTAHKGEVKDKFLEVLFAALEESNQDGFDYMEYKDFLRSLANVPMDDSTRFKSAFATAQTMGATKEKILSSAREYMKVLAREQTKFEEALSGQKERNLTSKQEEIKGLEQTIREKQTEIEKLTQDIETHRQHIGNLEGEINTASEKLSQTADDFAATYQTLLGQIEADVQLIESHL